MSNRLHCPLGPGGVRGQFIAELVVVHISTARDCCGLHSTAFSWTHWLMSHNMFADVKEYLVFAVETELRSLRLDPNERSTPWPPVTDLQGIVALDFDYANEKIYFTQVGRSVGRSLGGVCMCACVCGCGCVSVYVCCERVCTVVCCSGAYEGLRFRVFTSNWLWLWMEQGNGTNYPTMC